MQTKYIPLSAAGSAGWLRKALTLGATLVLAAVALMFSAILLAIILVIAVIGGIYLWWKMRELRKLMKNFQPPPGFATARGATMENEASRGEVFEGEVVEGEVIRVEDSRMESGRTGEKR